MDKGKKISKPRLPSVWTDERITILELMYNDGATDMEIATALGAGFNKDHVGCMRRKMGFSGQQAHITHPRDYRGKSLQRIFADLMAITDPKLLTPIEASVLHLIDLKRAGHSPTMTEQRIDPDGGLPWRWYPSPSVLSNSPAAACAEG